MLFWNLFAEIKIKVRRILHGCPLSAKKLIFFIHCSLFATTSARNLMIDHMRERKTGMKPKKGGKVVGRSELKASA